MKLLPFSIEIKGKTYQGYLGTADTADPPETFFVFLGDFIVAELLYRDEWIFDQGGRYKMLEKLNTYQCNYIAQYLGNVAVNAYRLRRHQTKRRATSTIFSDYLRILTIWKLRNFTRRA